MTEELVICEIRIDEAAGRGDSDSRMMSFEVIMPLKLQSTKLLIYSIWDMKSVLHYTISLHSTNCPIARSVVSAGNSWKRMTCWDKWKLAGWSLSSVNRLCKKQGSAWNCLCGHALKKAAWSIARLGYHIPVPDFYLVLHGLRSRKSTIMD